MIEYDIKPQYVKIVNGLLRKINDSLLSRTGQNEEVKPLVRSYLS